MKFWTIHSFEARVVFNCQTVNCADHFAKSQAFLRWIRRYGYNNYKPTPVEESNHAEVESWLSRAERVGQFVWAMGNYDGESVIRVVTLPSSDSNGTC